MQNNDLQQLDFFQIEDSHVSDKNFSDNFKIFLPESSQTPQTEEKKSFVASPLYQRIVSDIVAKNYILGNEYIAYNFKDAQEYMGWHDLSQKDIELFIDIVSDESEAIVLFDKPKEDHTEGFECQHIFRSSLEISVIWGQGTSIVVKPAAYQK